MRSVCRLLVKNTERKASVGRSVGRWKDNIKMEFKEMRWEDMA
jgi:hypothetical protein